MPRAASTKVKDAVLQLAFPREIPFLMPRDWTSADLSSCAYTTAYLTVWPLVTVAFLEFLQHTMLPPATGPLYMLNQSLHISLPG